MVLSRTRPKLVRRLFEQEIPEIQEGVITIHEVAREPGYRSKIAVSSMDPRVDCVGACVGVRGNRIKNIVDELGGTERIDIVRWEESPELLITHALQPAEVDQVLLCDMIGRAIVLVREDQLSLAIGRRGQNVRLASKLCGWDIELYTAEELEEKIDQAVTAYASLEGVNEELAQTLVEQGYLSYDDLSVIEPDAFMELGGLTAEQVDTIVSQAEEKAEEAERAAAEARRKKKEEDLLQKQADLLEKQAAAEAGETAPESAEGDSSAEPVAETADSPAATTPEESETTESEGNTEQPEDDDSADTTESPEPATEEVETTVEPEPNEEETENQEATPEN